MDMTLVGNQIALLRKEKGLTQNDLGDRLGVSFQAVSKWERGETLPDTALLPDLAAVLETSIDRILTGGRQITQYKGKISVSQMAEGLGCLKRMGELLGKDNILYRHAIDGINTAMDTNIEDAFTDDRILECFLAEAIIQNLLAGRYIDPTDVKNSFRHDRFREIVLDYCRRFEIR